MDVVFLLIPIFYYFAAKTLIIPIKKRKRKNIDSFPTFLSSTTQGYSIYFPRIQKYQYIKNDTNLTNSIETDKKEQINDHTNPQSINESVK